MQKAYLECAQIINKRGIAGELKANCLCDGADSIANVKVLYTDEYGKEPHNVISIKSYKQFIYIKLSDVSTPEQADSMRGMILYADRNDIHIDEDSVFIADILGSQVIDADNGKVYGTLTEVFNVGATDIYRIVNGKNEYLFPAAKEFVVKACPGEPILIKPISGMFDDAEEIK